MLTNITLPFYAHFYFRPAPVFPYTYTYTLKNVSHIFVNKGKGYGKDEIRDGKKSERFHNNKPDL